jgi:hypothetical protein
VNFAEQRMALHRLRFRAGEERMCASNANASSEGAVGEFAGEEGCESRAAVRRASA